jgi:hypothetical protein
MHPPIADKEAYASSLPYVGSRTFQGSLKTPFRDTSPGTEWRRFSMTRMTLFLGLIASAAAVVAVRIAG